MPVPEPRAVAVSASTPGTTTLALLLGAALLMVALPMHFALSRGLGSGLAGMALGFALLLVVGGGFGLAWACARWLAAGASQAHAVLAAQQALADRRLALVARALGGATLEWHAKDDALACHGLDALPGLAWPEGQRTGADLLGIIEDSGGERSLGRYLEGVAGADGGTVQNLRLRLASGEWCWLEARSQLTLGADGEATGATLLLMDRRAERAREAELVAAANRLRAALDALDTGVLCLDAEDRVIFCNQRYRELYGFRNDEQMAGMPFRQLVRVGFTRYPGELEGRSIEQAVDERMRLHRRQLGVREIELRLNRRWVLANDCLMADGGLLCLRTDITRVKTAEESLRERGELLDMAMRGSEAGLWHWDDPGDVLHLSARARELLGLPQGGPVAATLGKFVEQHGQPAQGELVLQAFRGLAGDAAACATAELQLKLADGSWRWYSVRATVKRDEQGRVLRAAGSIADIDARKAHAQELAQARQQLTDAIESLDAGLVMYDAQGRYVLSNARFRDFFPCDGASLQRGETPERTLRAFYAAHPERLGGRAQGEAIAQWLAVLRAGHGWRQQEFAGRWFQFDEFPTEDGGVVSLRTDITALREAEAAQRDLQGQLRQAQKMEAIGQLTGGIAHDFNNILASVLGYTGLALGRESVANDPRLRDYLEAVRTSGERARDLVAKMLAFSRNRSPDTRVEATQVVPLVEEAVSMLRSMIPANLKLRALFAVDLPAVAIDSVDLHQVLVNLAVNARDAIEGHGEILIEARAPHRHQGRCSSCGEEFDGQFLEIAVHDTGGGIPPELLTRLFEPFFTTKAVGRGTGMGLAVTHGVVHASGGHLLVMPRLGGGTSFRLLLRPVQATALPAAASLAPQAAPFLGERSIVVVDDEAAIARLWEDVLRDRGFSVQAFSDPTAALAWVRRPGTQIDLLLTDQSMPGLSGVELAAEVRALRGTVPVILCSGTDSRFSGKSAQELGMSHFHRKPVSIEAMMASIKAALAA